MKAVVICFIGIVLILALIWARVLAKKENKKDNLITLIKN
jgi:hypothetical protein